MTTFPDFSRFQYTPVIDLPAKYEVYDFSLGYDANRMRASEYGVGRYNEKRPGMYSTDLFKMAKGGRDIHMGVDIAAPIGCSVHAFYDGMIFMTGVNGAPGDYGGTVITEHQLGDQTIWALYGHLSHSSVTLVKPGDVFRKGQVIGWIGDSSENGGWNPHLHFQLSLERPERCDLPGVVSEADLEKALRTYPDPRMVLGPIY